MKVILPMSSRSSNFPLEDYPFPLYLTEIDGRPLIESVINNFKAVDNETHFVFVVSSEDCTRFSVDRTFDLLTDSQSTVIQVSRETGGATCSSLLAVDVLKDDEEVIVANADQIFESDLTEKIEDLRSWDAGVITFESVHPRWSYVKCDEKRIVYEAAEKTPISRNAIAGVYYYREASAFVHAAFNQIRKGASFNHRYYLSGTLNELILMQKLVGCTSVMNSHYHTFYSPNKIDEYNVKSKRGH